LKKNGRVPWRRVGDEVVLVPLGASRAELDDGVYLLDEVAAAMWLLIDGERTTAGIVDGIVEEFEVERERAATDLDALLDRLAGIGALEPEAE
jgi:hypothetical protein